MYAELMCVCLYLRVLCGRPTISHFAPHNRTHTHTHTCTHHQIQRAPQRHTIIMQSYFTVCCDLLTRNTSYTFYRDCLIIFKIIMILFADLVVSLDARRLPSKIINRKTHTIKIINSSHFSYFSHFFSSVPSQFVEMNEMKIKKKKMYKISHICNKYY